MNAGKLSLLAIVAVLAITMCVTTQQPQAPTPDIGGEAPPEEPAMMEATYCGLYIDLISPGAGEKLSGGFRVEWTLRNEGGESFTNKALNFTIYMKPSNGETTDVRTVTRYYGEVYKEDITFLNPVAKGNYVVGVRGKTGDCTLHEGERDVIV